MRLLKVDSGGNISLTDDLDSNIPPYAILSHTWGRDEDEVTFDDLRQQSSHSKPGYAKIRFCGEQARKDNLGHFWVDTCCIHKADQAEYSKSINSMFRWYRNAEKCYVYLSDVSLPQGTSPNEKDESKWTWKSDFERARWFTRGWTLQELIAPSAVEFFSREGESLGSKESLEHLIYKITGVPVTALRGVSLSRFTVDERIKWSAKRETQKEEDKVYCLFGIFNLFLPVFYGEGEKALERLKEEFNRSIRSKNDLSTMLYVPGAMFDSSDINHETCHPATRVELLDQIRGWAQDPQGKSIFWLNGMAGTGKSTISLTVAKWLAQQGHYGVVDIGASFFFKRGEGDRGNAKRFFLTIARSLGLMVPGMDHEIANEITTDSSIYYKALGEQFDKLIYQPLQKAIVTPGTCPILVVVVDALDECEDERDIRVILNLWSRLPQIQTIRLKLFLTSRPELPIRLGFKSMAAHDYKDMILEDAVPQATIKQDIAEVLRDSLSKIREEHNSDSPYEIHLAEDWPGSKILQELIDMAVPLFIIAATVCRFVADRNWDPQEQLERVLEFRGAGGFEQIAQTYLPVVKHLQDPLSDSRDRERLQQEFRTIIGAIIMLAEPLSATSLATLLCVPIATITRRLRPLHSVLQVPIDLKAPIRPLHLSFPEFLLSERHRDESFSIDGPATHAAVFTRCLELLSGPTGLRRNICGLQYEGQPRREIKQVTLDQCFPPAIQYACRYWVHHVQHSKMCICDEDKSHVFLRQHFLHWFEALSLMGRTNDVIPLLEILQSVTAVPNSKHVQAFLEDTRRFVLANRHVVDIAPLQVYTSAIVFAPQNSLVRNICGTKPSWLRRGPVTPQTWGPDLLALEGASDTVLSVAFSVDGKLLASGTEKQSAIRLWDPRTGQALQMLEGHTDAVRAVAFSNDSLLASGSNDTTIRVWDSLTGQMLQTLTGHTNWVLAVAFSSDSTMLASGSHDNTVRIWKLSTGQASMTLQGHKDSVQTVALSRDGTLVASGSRDKTVKLWDPRTGQMLQTLEGHTNVVWSVSFSGDGKLLASGSHDHTLRLWNLHTMQTTKLVRGHADSVRAVAFSNDDTLLASASDDDTIRLWDTHTMVPLRTLRGHTAWVWTVAFTHDDTLLASGSGDHTVRLWDLRAKQTPETLEGHPTSVWSMSFSHDGTLLVSNSLFDDVARLWNPRTGRTIRTLKGHEGSIVSAAFSSDGELIATGARDNTVRLWDPSTGELLGTLTGHKDSVRKLIFLSKTVLASMSYDEKIRLWDLRTGKVLEIQEKNWISKMALSNDCLQLAFASENTIELWNLRTERQLGSLSGHTDEVDAIAYSKDDQLLASASEDHTVRVWDLASRLEVCCFKGHTKLVRGAAFSNDNQMVASISGDDTIRVWSLRTGQTLQTIENVSSITTITFSPDDRYLITNCCNISIAEDTGVTEGSKPTVHKGFTIQKDWIQKDRQDVLWLPPEYRIRMASAVLHGNTLAIGLTSGRVIFMEFEDS